MNMPSIVFVARALDIGGAQRQLVELAVGLHRAGCRVSVVTFYGGGAFEAPLRQAGVPVVCLNKSGRWQVVSFLWRLILALRREQPDIVYSFIDMPNLLVTAIRPFLKNVRLVWGIAASNMECAEHDALTDIEWRLGIFLSRFADLVISNSEAGRHYHVSSGYPAERTVVVPNGIDVTHFRPDPAARKEIRAQWQIEPGMKLVGLVGRVDPVKDQANFIHAARAVCNERNDVRFVCAGPGSGAYFDEVVALARSLGLDGRLLWAGERTDIWRVYNALDLAVSSSLTEGLPNVIAEAMATGVPCVVTDVGDSAYVVGDLGWVCPPGDSAALAAAILKALAMLPRDGGPIREHVCAHYSSAALVERTLEQLRPLIAKGGRSALNAVQPHT
jgi:glycosyltransferase involved in cell wall biosynthesis